MPSYNTSSAPRKPSAEIISFPSSRCRDAVRVERERGDLGAWLTTYQAAGWLHGSYNDAFSDAHKMAADLRVAVVSSAGRLTP